MIELTLGELIAGTVALAGLLWVAARQVERVRQHDQTDEQLVERIQELEREGSLRTTQRMDDLERRLSKLEERVWQYLPGLVERQLERGEPLSFRQREVDDER